MACNNTTYILQVYNSTELQDEYFRHAYIVDVFNYNMPVAMLINKIVTPVWVIVGVFGNTLSAMVWANPHMRTCNTAAYYLTCLALADLTFLLVHSIYEFENPWLLGTLDAQGWCQIFFVFNISVQYFCVFLVFAFTVERYLSIRHPFKSERFGSTRTPRVIAALLVIAVLLGLPQAYFWEINAVGECHFRTAENMDRSFFRIYTWISELTIFGLLPLIVLALNSSVLLKIRSVGKLKIDSLKLKSASHHKNSDNLDETNTLVPRPNKKITIKRGRTKTRPRDAATSGSSAQSSNHSGTTVTLLWVSFYLIGTMLPNTFVYSLQDLFSYGPLPCQIDDMANHPTWNTYFTFASVKMIIKEISLSHHVGNIFIYLATSKRFVKLVMANLTPRSKTRKESNDTTLQTGRPHNHYNDHGQDV